MLPVETIRPLELLLTIAPGMGLFSNWALQHVKRRCIENTVEVPHCGMTPLAPRHLFGGFRGSSEILGHVDQQEGTSVTRPGTASIRSGVARPTAKNRFE